MKSQRPPPWERARSDLCKETVRVGDGFDREMVEKQGACRECGVAFTFKAFAWMKSGPTLCNSCLALVEKREARKVALGQFQDLGFPKDFRTWDPQLGNAALIKWVRKHCRSSMFLASRSGYNKTRCLCRVAYERLCDSMNVRFIFVPEWLRIMTPLLFRDPEGAYNIVQRAKNCQILVMDDLGKEVLTDRAGELLYELIDYRTRGDDKLLWVSSNWTGDDLEEHLGENYGPVIRRRLKDRCKAPGAELDMTSEFFHGKD